MKKKVNIFLLVLLTLLWGSIIYKYAGHLFGQNDQQNLARDFTSANLKIPQKDTFQLSPIARDPFLGQQIYAKTDKKNIPRVLSRSVKAVVEKEPVYVEFPSINYYGYIKSSSKEKQLVLVKINNSLFKLKVGQVQDGVSIFAATKDSVIVIFNKTKRGIKKS